MNKCIGCGALLQTEDKEKIGYVTNKENKYCERCFRINNYGDYTIVTKTNEDFINILKDINNTKDLVVLVVDLFNFDNIDTIKKYLQNDILLVLTKRDIFPSGIYEEKFIEYFKKYNFKDTIVISSTKNYNFDQLYEKINQYKNSNKVYIVGFTNAGKSTMINKLIYNYSTLDYKLTTSILPSTTLDKINIKLNENLTIIDTPGILLENSIYDKLSGKELKNILPKKTIKPISYQIKEKQYISVGKYLKIDVECANIVMFFSNNIPIKRFYKDYKTNLKQHEINVDNCDIVINGLGFIKIIGKGKVNIHTLEGVKVYTRKYLI